MHSGLLEQPFSVLPSSIQKLVMHRVRFAPVAILGTCLLVLGCQSASDTSSDRALREQAQALAKKYIMVDGHIDIPYRLAIYSEDIAQATIGGDFDYPRSKAGGLDAPFMSIYIPAERQQTPGASKTLADSLIEMVEGFAANAPDKFAIATSPDEVREQFEQGLISLPMGMENGAPIEDDLANVEYFFDRGIRYITLTHSRDNLICDSSYDTTRTHGGLSAFGEDVVREMNRTGIMVDISHVSDSTFYQVLRLTETPVIASHSSARHFTPGWERNMGDAMIQALGENDGVIMINFGSSFLRSEYRPMGTPIQQKFAAYLAQNNLARDSREAVGYFEKLRKEMPVGTIDDVVAHIEHVVNLVGIDHVGLGSDFDGVTTLPEGLNDVSMYPNLIYELLKLDYTEEEIAKLLGGNLLRVWDEVERVAAAS